MMRNRIGSIAGGAAAVLALSLAALAFTGAATAERGWTDAAGDANGAPDITGVTLSNDAAGTVTIRLAVALPADGYVFVRLDTNVNGSVGDTTDCTIAASRPGGGGLFSLAMSPNADGTQVVKPVPSLKATLDDTGVTISFAKSELGIGDTFVFFVESSTDTMIDQGVDGDRVPDGNVGWVYAIEKAPPPTPTTTTSPVVVKPLIDKPTAVPAKAAAGKRLTVTFPVRRSDTGAPLKSGKMICDPSIAGKVIPHSEQFANGVARLSFTVPAGAKGKALKVKVTIQVGGQAATRVATFPVR